MLYTSTKHSSTPSTPSELPSCYFSYVPLYKTSHDDSPPASPTSALFGIETPSDPSNPLLALRTLSAPSPPPSRPAMDASKLMQLQASAAHRPAPHPMQAEGVLRNSSDSTSTTSSSPSMDQTFRCSRCHRSSSWGSSPQDCGMVTFGTNLYYCKRCASIVGYSST